MKRFFSVIGFLLITSQAFSQSDTTYYRKYNESMMIALYQSFVRQFDIEISENFSPDSGKSGVHYFSDADVVSGIAIDYDKFGIAFAYRSVPPADAKRKGNTKYFNLSLNIGGIKWRLESSYRKYKGFYDKNTANYTPSFNDSTPYYQNGSMSNENIKFKFLYFFNHKKFAYKTTYGSNYRQLKSAASWMLLGNLYFNHFGADSSVFPFPVRNYYGELSDLDHMRVVGLSAGGGFSWNLIILKRFFANLTFGIGLESQWRKYHHASGNEEDRLYISGSGDVRSSIGYSGDKFFVILSSMNDITNFDSGMLNMTTKFISGAFQFGYRFHVKTPGFYKKIQETGVYKKL